MLLTIHPEDPRPIYRQITDQIKEQIMAGLLRPGEELPSVRELAAMLRVNMHTVHRAYQELKEQGIVLMRLGQKVRVAANARAGAVREEDRLKLKEEIHRLSVDAYHLGLSKDDFLRLVIEVLRADTPKED